MLMACIEHMLLLVSWWIVCGTVVAQSELCPTEVPNGVVESQCSRQIGSVCKFKCDSLYKPAEGVQNVTCGRNGKWTFKSPVCVEKDLGMIMTLKNETFTKDLFILPLDSMRKPIPGYIRSYRYPEDALFTSVAGDYTLQHAYMYDYYSHTIYRDANFSIDVSGNEVMMIFHRGLSSDYVNLAVDWISHNIYWTDESFKWIMVKSLLNNDMSMHRVLIDDNLNGPRALALDPMEGLLFWSDIGTWSKIEVSSLSGRNRKTLISSKLIYPYSLAADYAARRLFLYDSGRKSLESFTYEGKDRKNFRRDEYADIFGIALYKDGLYMTDKRNKHYLIVNKTNGDRLYESTPINVQDRCSNHRCAHICVSEKDEAICLCKDGYTLNQDNETCSLRTEYFHRGLIFSNASSICVVDIRVVADFAFVPKCVMSLNGATHMVMDTDQREMIIANETSIYRVPVDNPILIPLANSTGKISELLIIWNANNVLDMLHIASGLALDGYDRYLYWTVEDSTYLFKMKGDRYQERQIFRYLTKPRDLIIVSHERLICFIANSRGSTIKCMNMRLRDFRTIVDSTTVVDPKSLTYDMDTKRLFFLDTFGKDEIHIRSVRLDGSNLRTFRSSERNIDMLETYKGYLLATSSDVNMTLIVSYSISTGEEKTSGVFPNTGKISSIKIFDENIRQNETGPCYRPNAVCQHICIPHGKRRECQCRSGFSLTLDGHKCTSEHKGNQLMLVVDSTDNTVYQINMLDDIEKLQGIGITSRESLSGITYSPFDNVLIFGASSALYITYHNGRKKTVIPIYKNMLLQNITTFAASYDDVVYTPNRFAVDHSTGNIYYTVTNNQRVNKTFDSYIRILSPTGRQRNLVLGLNDPSGLVLYPSKGLLFYSEGQLSPCIVRANMDGSQWSILLELPLENPTGLTIDYTKDILYYIDSLCNSVKYCNMDGTDHNTLIAYSGDNSILAAIVNANYLLISTTRNSSIIQVDLSNPSVTKTFAHYGELGRISSISMFASSTRNTNTSCNYDNGGCSTFCFPKPDGRVCGCEDGIELKDGSDTECSIMNDPVLLMTSKKFLCKENIYIQHISLEGIFGQRQIYPYDCNENIQITSIAGDSTLHHIYMHDVDSRKIYKVDNFSIDLPGKSVMTVFHRGVSRDFINLAVDWISHNIYWTDASYQWIMVQSIVSNDLSMHRVLIHNNLDRPRALALDPMEGLLFWSDIGIWAKIERSSLSGRNRKTLISSELMYPSSLAADYAARRLYFHDFRRKTLESCTYEGTDRKIVFSEEPDIFGIAVYKNYLYLASYNKFRVAHKRSGFFVDTSYITESFIGISLYRSDATSYSPTANCTSHGCEHICVAEKDVTTCLCKDGYTLNEDLRTCSLRTQYFHRGLMFSNDSSVCVADVRAVTDFTFDPICVMSVNGTTHMVLDTDQRRMILAKEMSIYWASVDNPSLHLLTEAHGIISGLAWDGYKGSVYWTEKDTGDIWSHSEEANISYSLFKGLKEPRDIIVLSHESRMYWISDRNGSAIESSNTDGSNHSIVLNLANPRSLCYDQNKKRIYFLDDWSDSSKDRIASIELDGSDVKFFRECSNQSYMLEIYKGLLLVTQKDDKGTLLTSYSINTHQSATSGMFHSAGHNSAIKIFDENIRQNETVQQP